MIKRLGAFLTAILALLLAAGGAEAAITPTRTATDLAAAVAAPDITVTGASFADVPAGGNPNAVSDVPLGDFPTDGPTYAILSTGDAGLADDANASTSSGADDGGTTTNRGPGAHDVTVLRVDVNVPSTANCLTLGFRFESEEYPEFVNQTVNDGFIAELDTSDWTTNSDSSITAPNNFAFDPSGEVISINSSGATSMSATESADTTYDGATPRLSAAQTVTPGSHSLYLSIFDQGDANYDSAVFVDAVGVLNTAPGGCVPGAQTAPPIEVPPPPPPPPIVEPLPPVPVQGTTVTVGVVSGKVRVKLRGSSRFVLLDGTDPIPVGSTVDATAGRVRLTSAAGGGKTQTADFYKGTFQVLQSKGEALTELKLGGPSLASCAKSARSSAKKKPVRRLFGDGKGSFRTRGRHAAATVRGTKWLTQDTCAGTLVKVSRGRVSVRDFTKKRTVTVRAGRSYLARP